MSWIPRIFRSRTQIVLPLELLARIYHLLPQCFSVCKISLLGQFLWQFCSACALPCKMTPARIKQPLKTHLDSLPYLWPFFKTSCWLRDSLCLVTWTVRATSRAKTRLLSLCLPARHWSHLSLSVIHHHPPRFSAASLCVVRRQWYLAHSNAVSCIELKSKQPSGEHLKSLHWTANATAVLPLHSPNSFPSMSWHSLS